MFSIRLPGELEEKIKKLAEKNNGSKAEIVRKTHIIATLITKELESIMALSDRYKDLPMDFTDTTLLVIAEKENIKDVITLDSDFSFYRINRDQMLNNLLG